MWRYKRNSQILELKSLWRFFLMLDLFLRDFVKQIVLCCFPKGTPQQWEIWQSWGSPCAAGNWHPLGCRSTNGVRGITYLHCCILQIQLIWQLGHRSSRICEGSNLQALQHFWGACPDQLVVCQVLSKKHLKSAVDFTFGIHQSAQKHLHHWIMEWSFIAESQVILHHLTSLDLSPKRSLRWHLKHLEVADAAKKKKTSTRLKRYQLGGWVLLPSRLLQDLHLNCKHWYKTRCWINYCNPHFLLPEFRDSGWDVFFGIVQLVEIYGMFLPSFLRSKCCYECLGTHDVQCLDVVCGTKRRDALMDTMEFTNRTAIQKLMFEYGKKQGLSVL